MRSRAPRRSLLPGERRRRPGPEVSVPSAAASSMAAWLSPSASARSTGSVAVRKPPRQSVVTGEAGVADQPGGRLQAVRPDGLPPQADVRDARPAAGVDQVRHRQLPDRHLVDGETLQVRAHWFTPLRSSRLLHPLLGQLGVREQAEPVGECVGAGEVRHGARPTGGRRPWRSAPGGRPARRGGPRPSWQKRVGAWKRWRDSSTVGSRSSRKPRTSPVSRARTASAASGPAVEDAEQGVAGSPGRRPRSAGGSGSRPRCSSARPGGSRRLRSTSRCASREGDLDAVHLVRVGGDDLQEGVGGRVQVGRAPVALQGRVEHRAQPVQDHRFGGLAGADGRRSPGSPRGRSRWPPGAGGHEDGLRARLLDDRELLLVRGPDLGERAPGELVGADAAGDRPPTARASAALRRISSAAPAQSRPMPRWAVSIASATPSPWDHRWRRKASVASQSTAAGASGETSAYGSATTWARGEDRTGGEGGAGGDGEGLGAGLVRPQGAVGGGESDGHREISGTSMRRPSAEDFRPSSASCTPRAPASRSQW